MSNAWSYSVVLHDRPCLSGATVTDVVQTLNRMDYSVWNPGSKKITGMGANATDELEFDDWEAAQAYLCLHGGLITTWKALGESDYRDVSLTLFPDRREVRLSVNYDLSEARKDDIQAAKDLGLLFAALCDRLDPVYGYSTDEHRLEDAFPDVTLFLQAMDNLYKAVRTLTPPPMLFWLNYFSQSYFEQITEQRLSDLPLQRKRARKGIYVLLSEHPWGARVAILEPNGRYKVA